MTKPYGDPEKARVLVVGHDPRLQSSDTAAEYAFFADYFFRTAPRSGPEKRKYGLAASVFHMVASLTCGRVEPDEVLLTNLCNQSLPHAPKRKTVLIPETAARVGVSQIAGLVSNSTIKVVLAMSQQVNYWLRALEYCDADPIFVKEAKPKQVGVDHAPPYYEPQKPKAFLRVCGQALESPGEFVVVPVLHVKQWPLNPRMSAYEPCVSLAERNVSQLLIS